MIDSVLELYIALSDKMVGVQEALLACPKMRIIDPNIKKAQNIVMERESENPTPTIDIEQKGVEIIPPLLLCYLILIHLL